MEQRVHTFQAELLGPRANWKSQRSGSPQSSREEGLNHLKVRGATDRTSGENAP